MVPLQASFMEFTLKTTNNNTATHAFTTNASTHDGDIQSSYASIDGAVGNLAFEDVFTWDHDNQQWHGYLEVAFNVVTGQPEDPYFAIDFIELSTSLRNIGTLRVGPDGDYTTVQEAINAALDGDTIIVSPGTYKENLEMKGKNITLRSLDPLDEIIVAATILDGDSTGTGEGPVITLQGNEENAAIQGFTIQHGDSTYGGGILGKGAILTIENNVITNNKASFGGGIALISGLVRYNDISNNDAYVDAAIDGNGYSEPTGAGGGVFGASQLWQNDIHDNTAAIGGGGVWNRFQERLFNNIIHDNNVTDISLATAPGAGVHIADTPLLTLFIHNTLVNNTWNGMVVNAIDESASSLWFNNILWDTANPLPGDPNTDWVHLQGSDLRFNLIGGAPLKGTDSCNAPSIVDSQIEKLCC